MSESKIAAWDEQGAKFKLVPERTDREGLSDDDALAWLSQPVTLRPGGLRRTIDTTEEVQGA